MFGVEIKELGNNRYQINGEDVYAPNLNVAKDRFVAKHPEHHNDLVVERKLENAKKRENSIKAKVALRGTNKELPKNNSYIQHAHG